MMAWFRKLGSLGIDDVVMLAILAVLLLGLVSNTLRLSALAARLEATSARAENNSARLDIHSVRIKALEDHWGKARE